MSTISKRLAGSTGSTVGLDDRMKGCECPEPHTYGDDVIVRLLRTLREARLQPDEEISAVGMFVRSWLDLRKDEVAGSESDEMPNTCPSCGGVCPDSWHRWAPGGTV